MPERTLITFPPSLDSEFSRFLLTHYGLPFQEERHALVFSSFATLRCGHTVRFPLLCEGCTHLNTVKKMIDHFEVSCAPEQQLRPKTGGSSLAEEGNDWQLFHKTLSTATTVFAYYNLLPDRAIMVGPLSDGTPESEAKAVRRAYPAFATLLRLLLRLSAQREQNAAKAIRDVMGATETRLADGRPYLRGDRFTLSDMAFAVAAAPVTWPPEYGGAVPPLEETPTALRAMIDEIRGRPAGAFALKIYREHRLPAKGAS